jgi:hypothetical protein
MIQSVLVMCPKPNKATGLPSTSRPDAGLTSLAGP